MLAMSLGLLASTAEQWLQAAAAVATVMSDWPQGKIGHRWWLVRTAGSGECLQSWRFLTKPVLPVRTLKSRGNPGQSAHKCFFTFKGTGSGGIRALPG